MVKNIFGTKGLSGSSLFKRAVKPLALILGLLPAVCFSTDYTVGTQAEFDAIKNTVLQPGDAILLERGQQFVGMLSPTGKGTEADPIRISAFGEGDRPLIDAQGLNQAGVLLEGDIAFWEVSGLEIINNDGTDNDDNYFFGVLVSVSGPDNTIYEHIYIDDNYIHDVNGGVEGKDRGGIHVYMEGLDDSIIDDLRITNNRIEDVGGVGIATKSSCGNVTVHEAGGYTAEYLWTGVYIGGNYVNRTGRNSIIIRVGQDPIVERNVAAYAGRHSQGNSIFCFDTVGCIMQYNETYGNTVSGSSDSSSSDRGGFDADYTCVDTYIQYNYSHDNEYFVAIMKKIQRNVVIRYNVTQDEKRGFYFYGFNSNSEVEDVHIYNNTHYVSAGNSAAVFVEGRTPHDTLLENNIFYFEDAADASYGTGNLSGATFNNNLYYNITPHASDLNPVSGDPLFTLPGVVGTDIDLTTMDALRGYQLLVGSPSIDTSSAIAGSVDEDIMGNLIDDGTADVGALEFQGSTSRVTFDFLDGSVWDKGTLGAHASLTNLDTGVSITLRTIDVIGQDGSKVSEGAKHITNISGTTYLGIDDQAGNIGGYSTEYRNFNPNEGWVFAFDEDVYLENIQLGSQNEDAELTLSSDVFVDMILADGQPSDIHDLKYRYVPAGTELSLMMTTATNGVDTGIGVTSITVSAVPFLSRPTTVVQAELNDNAIGVVVQPSSDEGGGQMVEFDVTGDEISYEVNVPNAGTYLVGFRVASDSGLLNLELTQDGMPLTTLNRMIDAGEIWTTVYKMITLEAGESTLTISATDGEPQLLNWFDLTSSAGSPTMVSLPFADGFDGGFAPTWDSTAFLSATSYEGEKSAKMNNADSVEAGIDTTGYSGIRVTYARKTDGLSSGSSFVSEWYDGTSWNTVESISSGFTSWEVVSQIVLPAGADNNPNFRLRFRVNAGSDYSYVDSVVVDGVNLPMTIAMNVDSISFEWFNVPSATYAVQRSTNLVTDAFSTTIESGIPSLTEMNNITIEMSEEPNVFYRVIAE